MLPLQLQTQRGHEWLKALDKPQPSGRAETIPQSRPPSRFQQISPHPRSPGRRPAHMAPPGACYELRVSPHGTGGPGPAELMPSLKHRVEPAGLFLNQDTSEHLKEHAEADGEPPSSGFNLDTRHEPNDKNTERRQAGHSGS